MKRLREQGAEGRGVRGLCQKKGGRLREAYNEAVIELEKFRCAAGYFAESRLKP